jgi:hypothetical protein
VIATSPAPVRKGKAMIMRARCYDLSEKSGPAKAEYRQYLRWFPKGSYADEARDAS